MTVITLPSAGAKSDKVPLFDAVDGRRNEIPSPSYHPKHLESGEKDGGVVGESVRSKRLAFRMTRVVLISLALVLALIVLFSGGVLCKAYHSKIVAQHQRQWQQLQQGELQQEQDAYADTTDSDLMSLQPLPSSLPFEIDDYDAGQLGAIDGLYKKLENEALGATGDVISIIDAVEKGDDNGGPPVKVTIRSAHFIHDFSVNVTGIVDADKKCCFVMPLMRSPVTTTLFDLLFKISKGYFAMDIKSVVGNMRVIKPAIKDLSGYGAYISKDCANYTTFKLEKCDENGNALDVM